LEQDLNWKVLLSPTFRNASLLSGQNLSTLGKLLKVRFGRNAGFFLHLADVLLCYRKQETNDPIDNSAPSGAPVTQTLTTGSWKPQVHFIWDIIMDTYFAQDDKSASLKDKASFQEFYRITVDGGFADFVIYDLAVALT
jgi:DNA polymerase phi